MKKQRMKKILFLDILTGDKKLRKELEKQDCGSNADIKQIRRLAGLTKNQLVAIDGSKGKFPKPDRFAAIIIGGSTEHPVRGYEKPWMKKVYKFIRKAARDNVPILGLCGGLQFTVKALGGEIIFNPEGRDFGNTRITLTKAGVKDKLFKGLAIKNIVLCSHKCIVKKLRGGWRLLAFSKKTPIEAIAIRENIRLTQFHPEMSLELIKQLAKMRKNALIQEKLIKAEDFPKFLTSIKNTDRVGSKVLKNFITYFVK